MESTNEERIERTEVMLSLADNPYDYFTQFDDWLTYDHQKGFDTCGYVARIIELLGGIHADMTQKEEDALISKAIDEVFEFNPLSFMYKRVYRTVVE